MDEGKQASVLAARLMIYKYVLFVILICIVGLWLYRDSDQSLSLVEIAKGILYSVVSALLISAFYDIFTRSEAAIIRINEKREMHKLIETKFISYLDIDAVGVENRRSIIDAILRSEEALREITNRIVGIKGGRFYNSFLQPLIEKRAISNVSISNVLSSIDGDDACYNLEYNEKFEVPANKNNFIVLFSCDNEVFNDVVASSIAIDSMVGTGENEWGDIDEQIKSLKLLVSRVSDNNKREVFEISPKNLSKKEIEAILGGGISSSSKIRVIAFDLRHAGAGWRYEFSYLVRQSFEYPYYYWFAENPMFVNSITIDYRAIIGVVGRVSANCILGNNSSKPEHDRRRGIYRVEVDGLVWPGQGAMIVWKSK